MELIRSAVDQAMLGTGIALVKGLPRKGLTELEVFKFDDSSNCKTVEAGLFEEVKDRLDAPGTSISGGQQQRLCIARTIAVSPEVILMDEPCSALDPIATAKIEELIYDLKKNFTIVIVTHAMQQAARVSQRTAYFHLGNLVEVGPTSKIFTTPQHKLTESYITGRFG